MAKLIRPTAALIGAALVVLGLTACGPDHGIVHGKQHFAAYWYTTTSCHTIGKSTVCFPSMHYMPPSWELDVYASKDDHGWVNVTETTYEHEQVGDYVDFRDR